MRPVPQHGAANKTVQGMATRMRAMHAGAFEKIQTATLEERQDMMNGMFASRNEAHRLVAEAAQTLLPSLTPEQKTKSATSLPGLIGPGPGMGGGMGPAMGGGGAAPRNL